MRAKIICLTPIKNEAWILESFLKATSLWADHIILADQNSSDDSEKIARKFPKVIYIKNEEKEYNELNRQKLLIDEARKIEGKRLLITLDADEFFSNIDLKSASWNTMLNADEGVVFRFKWAHISPDFEKCAINTYEFPWGFIDDNRIHYGRTIHSPRIPVPESTLNYVINDNIVFHYGFILPNRVLSKNRWYKVFEKINSLEKNCLIINQKYNVSNVFLNSFEYDKNWINQYIKLGIDMTSFQKQIINLQIKERNFDSWRIIETYWWDIEVLLLIEKHSSDTFRKLDIWDFNWKELAKYKNFNDLNSFNDPRTLVDKIYIRWSRYSSKYNNKFFSIINKFLRYLIP